MVAGTYDTLSASATGGTGAFTYSWAFGDGTVGTGPNPSHAYSLPPRAPAKDFAATVTVMDAAGNYGTASVFVHVLSPVSTTAFVAYTAVDPGQPQTFTPGAAGGSGSYTCHWDFGDGTSANGYQVKHAYSQPGVYKAWLTTTDSTQATAKDDVDVYVNDRVALASTGSTMEGVAGRFAFIRQGTVGNLPVKVTYDGGSATPGVDYDDRYTPRIVTIPNGTNTAYVPIYTWFDNQVEGNETVVLNMSITGGLGYTAYSDELATSTMVIYDSMPTVTLVPSGPSTVAEGVRICSGRFGLFS